MDNKIDSQKWFVINSKPFKEFIAGLDLENTGKNKFTEEYNLPNGKNITVDHNETIFLVDKDKSMTIGTLPKDNTFNKPVIVYRGGVISEKRLKAFIEE